MGETGGQESHCPSHENVTFVEIWSFLAWTSVVKRLFLLIKIIELCVNDQGIHKVCRFDHKQMFRPVSVELWLSDKNQVKSCFKPHSRCSPQIPPCLNKVSSDKEVLWQEI